jgi:hypothetical protein
LDRGDALCQVEVLNLSDCVLSGTGEGIHAVSVKELGRWCLGRWCHGVSFFLMSMDYLPPTTILSLVLVRFGVGEGRGEVATSG